ncbi:TPA: hypothetical protein N0F65_011723 [Lagenidium giganteum]|uniref:Uncharacterized protein n=1 Tax=Lagenidium giganteum TaxID=4803 RepID=A0AAV2YHU6_9STRA|nr:TPA: hypothetical protein N0F65_011723 [Lagenidium giganteum]
MKTSLSSVAVCSKTWVSQSSFSLSSLQLTRSTTMIHWRTRNLNELPTSRKQSRQWRHVL